MAAVAALKIGHASNAIVGLSLRGSVAPPLELPSTGAAIVANIEVHGRRRIPGHKHMSQRVLWVSIAITLALAATSAFASDRSLRCGTHLVYGGGGKNAADKYEVLKKCGEPVEKMGLTWIYVQGNSTRTLTFDYSGKLQLIETRRN